MNMSFNRLIDKIIETQNPTVVGLDPKLEYVPGYLREKAVKEHGANVRSAAAAIYAFNKGIIDAVCDIVPAVKIQSAYYEMYGYHGVKILCKTIKYAKKKGLFVIVDAKRNDIGATMEAYSAAYLGTTDIGASEEHEMFAADALTVNGYLGTDGIMPALELCKKNDKGIFVLVKTSNKSSGELQDRKLESGETVYEAMGAMCEKWGSDNIDDKYGYSCVGAVVGATYPEQLAEMRSKMPHTFLLVPGYGAQGGGAEGASKAFDECGLGAVVNSSRAIMLAYKNGNYSEKEFGVAALNEVIRMKQDLTSYITMPAAPASV